MKIQIRGRGGGGQRMTQKKSYLPKKYDSKKKISPAKKY